MTKQFHELSGKEQEKLFQEAAKEERRKTFEKGWCCAEAGMNDAVAFAFPPDGSIKIDKKDIREAIEYAIRSNQAEGLDTSKNTEELLNQVIFGEITLDQVRQIIDQQAKALKIVREKAINAAILSNRMEGLELDEEALAMLERVKKGEVTLDEYEQAAIDKYTALSKGKHITLDEALKIVKS